MKQILIVSLILMSFTQIQAQGIFSKERLMNRENHDKQKLRWGYYLGLNWLDYDFEYEGARSQLDPSLQDIQTTKSMGFNVGLIGNMRINDYLDLRTEPGVFFNTRTLYFPNIPDEDDRIRDIEATTVHIPLLLKISTKRLNNFKPFIVGGVSNSINLSSREGTNDDNSNGTFRVKKNTFNYELGFGIDFFLPYFKFTPSVRGIFSMVNEAIPDEDPFSPYTSFITNMETRGVFLNFTFQ